MKIQLPVLIGADRPSGWQQKLDSDRSCELNTSRSLDPIFPGLCEKKHFPLYRSLRKITHNSHLPKVTISHNKTPNDHLEDEKREIIKRLISNYKTAHFQETRHCTFTRQKNSAPAIKYVTDQQNCSMNVSI